MSDRLIQEEGRTDNRSEMPQAGTAGDTRYYTGIDWTALIFRLLENIHWILLSAILCAVVTGLYVWACVKPIYQATAKIYIAGSETTISLSDIQLGSSLATDYQEAFKIWHVHELVDEKLGLDYSYSKLSDMVSVYSPSGSHILYINAQSSDPQEAKLLADTYATVVQDFIADKMELRRPQLIQVAQVPTRPISPNIRTDILIALLVGGFLAAAIVILLYLMDDRVRTSDDIEKATGLATLGMLMKQAPETLRAASTRAGGAPPSGAHSVVIRSSLSLGYAGDEAINAICSAITFAGKNMKRIAVTSCGVDDGKTFVAMHIARGMADRGERVLVIDGDLRKASITAQYRIRHASIGLAHLLSGQCELKDAIYSTNIPNLFLLPAGESIMTPLPLLTSPDFERLMDYVARAYDHVIVDTPPVGVVIDAAEVAKRCDGSLLVLEYNKHTKGALRDMQKALEQTRTPVIGCVLNKVVPKRLSPKGYYYRYSDNYGYYASDKASRNQKGRSSRRGRKK